MRARDTAWITRGLHSDVRIGLLLHPVVIEELHSGIDVSPKRYNSSLQIERFLFIDVDVLSVKRSDTRD